MKKILFGAIFLVGFVLSAEVSAENVPSSYSNMYSYVRKPNTQITTFNWAGTLTIGKDSPKEYLVTVSSEDEVLKAMRENRVNSANFTDRNDGNQFLVTRDGDMLISTQLFGDSNNNQAYEALLAQLS